MREQKFKIEVKEVIARFEASIFTLGSFLTKKGKNEILNSIDNFTILKRDKKEVRKEEKKLPPKGSYERLMNIFGGKR